MRAPHYPVIAAETDRGPCARALCAHREPDHRPDGGPCGECGACPSYRAPSRRPCYRCGIPEDVHPGPPLAGLGYLPPDACPWWVRPPAWPLRALAWILGR